MKPYGKLFVMQAPQFEFLSNYMLYNFHDTPNDLFQRMRINTSLNEELGTQIYSFPMRYQPTDRPIEAILVNTGINIIYARFKLFFRLLMELLVVHQNSLKKHLVILRMISKNSKTPHKYISMKLVRKIRWSCRASEFNSEFRKLDESEINELIHYNSNVPSECKRI